MRKQKLEQDLRHRLSNYIISKKSFNTNVSGMTLSKKTIKAIHKRKAGKKTLL
jgi:hypothetical protein